MNYRDQIAGEIIDRIAAGTAPWQKPWNAGTIGVAPFNPTSGKPYHGINDVWLTMQGRADPRWMTYRQANEAGAQVRKGEKSTTIEYWQWTERSQVKDDQGKPVLDGDGQPRYETVRLERPRVFYAKVFNGQQIDGLPPFVPPTPSFDPIERAEALINGAGVPVLHDQGNRAFYRPSTDKIHLPAHAAFKSQESYYETVLHELGHATGHPSRLNREFGPFGSEVYAREELKAEIASYMLARDMGISFDPSNHAAYVESWLKALREDKNEIFRAARDAESIKTWVMEPERRPELEQAAGKAMTTEQKPTTPEPAKTPPGAILVDAQAWWNDQTEIAHERATSFDELREDLEALGPEPAPGEKIWVDAHYNRLDILSPTTKAKQTPAQKTRHYIAVPFAEKEQAKAAGAKWDRAAKSWYVPDGANAADFAKWANKSVDKTADLSPEAEFAQALKDHGLIVDGNPIMDGHWHRCPVKGDKGKLKSGSYVGYLDGRPSGNITNYKSGGTHKWVATGVTLTAEDRAQLQAEAAAIRADRQQKIRDAAELAAKRAYGIWSNLPAAATADNAPYLTKKGVAGHGVKVNDQGDLVIPCRDTDGFLWNIQTVTADTKTFLKDSHKSGTFHILEKSGQGTPDALRDSPIIIAEGYATAASIHESTGWPVVAAFDSSNLGPVAEALRAKFPDHPILIAADNDHSNINGNVGLTKATEAAQAVGGSVVAPNFTAEERSRNLTDFNDLAQARGQGQVQQTIESALSQIFLNQDRGIA